ncbi:MAG: hypothetical protein WDZ63_05130 [Burkholderiales bacterium]
MIFRATLIWVIGLVTIVPFGTYYLLFHAGKDQYAILIVGVLFWIFGYWGVVGPVLAAVRVHTAFAALEQAHARGRLREAMRSEQTADAVIDLIAAENRIPRFLAARVFRFFVGKFGAVDSQAGAPDAGNGRRD